MIMELTESLKELSRLDIVEFFKNQYTIYYSITIVSKMKVIGPTVWAGEAVTDYQTHRQILLK